MTKERTESKGEERKKGKTKKKRKENNKKKARPVKMFVVLLSITLAKLEFIFDLFWFLGRVCFPFPGPTRCTALRLRYGNCFLSINSLFLFLFFSRDEDKICFSDILFFGRWGGGGDIFFLLIFDSFQFKKCLSHFCLIVFNPIDLLFRSFFS